MTLERHPSDESLLRYVSGSLSAGPSLVVAAHLEAVPRLPRAGCEIRTTGRRIT